MKLNEFEVHHRQTGTRSHGDAVSGRDGRVGRVQIGLPSPSGSQEDGRGRYGDHPFVVGVVKVEPKHVVGLSFDWYA